MVKLIFMVNVLWDTKTFGNTLIDCLLLLSGTTLTFLISVTLSVTKISEVDDNLCRYFLPDEF